MQVNATDGSESQNSLGTWQYYLDYIRKNDSFNGKEKARIISGLSKLQELFMDDWLRDVTESGHLRHPFLSYISNYAPCSSFGLLILPIDWIALRRYPGLIS